MQSRKIWISSLFLVPIIVIAMALIKRGKIDKGTQKMNQLAAGWATQKFETVNETEQFKALLSQIPIRNNASASNDELDYLNNAINDFFVAFHRGYFEDYTRFRMPTGRGHYNPENLRFRVNKIIRAGQIPVTTNLENGLQISQNYWEFRKTNFVGFFQGLCVSKSTLDINKFIVLPQPADFAYKMGMSSIGSTFISEPTPEQIKDQYGEVLFATLIALIKNSGGTAYPVACRWYYSPKDKMWIPHTLGDDHSRGNIKYITWLTF